ncbi:MAG TPA: L-2-hydroxyglutarate oxidase [Fibrobacteria bacterium]|nr:L-2-hydroxyglutarate oxidase [Fibrobacteria bacterium]
MKRTDILIAGGGIVGLATAWRLLQRFPDRKVLVLEKESGVARHQTGHNSGVIHSGIYYKPGSFKALLCRRGYAEMVDFCRENGVPHDICGKLVVAVSRAELPQLEILRQRAGANGLRDVTVLERGGFERYEPHVAGLKALHVPETGIVDYVKVSEKLAERIRGLGGDIQLSRRVESLRTLPGEKIVKAGDAEYAAAFFINCGGLMSDRVARLDGIDPGVSIVPFRGEYYDLDAQAQTLVKNLIYPVPDPAFPFLGVHFTRMVGGGVECGPNAVLAFKREGYRKSDVSAKDLAEVLGNPGFRKLAAKHWRMGLGEFHRSFSKAAFVKALQRLLPEVRGSMLKPAGSGVRAQALRRDGSLVDDFAFAGGPRSLHVLNAPSPAATASLAIGKEIADRYAASV